MKNFFSPFAKFIALAACALTLGSCSRSEYAMLPKGSSYHGVTRAATPVPAAAPAMAATPAAEFSVAVAPAVPATALLATTPAAVAAPVVTKTAVSSAVAASAAAEAAATVAAAPAPRLNLVHRLALNKVTRKIDKLMQKSGSVRRHDNTASTAKGGISGNLRTGIIFLLVGLLISLFGGISGIFAVIGTIFAIIGLVFIILWLLDQA